MLGVRRAVSKKPVISSSVLPHTEADVIEEQFCYLQAHSMSGCKLANCSECYRWHAIKSILLMAFEVKLWTH